MIFKVDLKNATVSHRTGAVVKFDAAGVGTLVKRPSKLSLAEACRLVLRASEVWEKHQERPSPHHDIAKTGVSDLVRK